MSSQLIVEKYIEHLIHKWYIFKPQVQIEASNCIDEVDTITSSLTQLPCKIND
jgi:hypothetical protein